MIKRQHYPAAALAAVGLLAASFSLGHLSVSHAQDSAQASPAATTAADQTRPLPPADGPKGPGPEDGPGPRPKEGPGGPHGPRPPHPPRPEEDQQPPARPADPQAAPTAVKTATDALPGLTAGAVWTRTAPRGEQQVQAALVFEGKEVARLEFDPANGSLQARGQHLPPPPPAAGGPEAGPREHHRPAARVKNDAANTTDAATSPDSDADKTTDATATAPTANVQPVKDKLAGIVKELTVGQGAEIMPREGFWKVPLIYQNRVVGELRLSGDGTKVMQDFGASRDAAIYAK